MPPFGKGQMPMMMDAKPDMTKAPMKATKKPARSTSKKGGRSGGRR